MGATAGGDCGSHQGPACSYLAVLCVSLSLFVNLWSRGKFLTVTLPMEGWTRDQVTWGQSWLGCLTGWHFILWNLLCLPKELQQSAETTKGKVNSKPLAHRTTYGVAVKEPEQMPQSFRKGMTLSGRVKLSWLSSEPWAHPLLPSGKLSSLDFNPPRAKFMAFQDNAPFRDHSGYQKFLADTGPQTVFLGLLSIGPGSIA